MQCSCSSQPVLSCPSPEARMSTHHFLSTCRAVQTAVLIASRQEPPLPQPPPRPVRSVIALFTAVVGIVFWAIGVHMPRLYLHTTPCERAPETRTASRQEVGDPPNRRACHQGLPGQIGEAGQGWGRPHAQQVSVSAAYPPGATRTDRSSRAGVRYATRPTGERAGCLPPRSYQDRAVEQGQGGGRPHAQQVTLPAAYPRGAIKTKR